MLKSKWLNLLALLAIAALITPQAVYAQAADTVPRVLAAVNSARIANGLPPYALNSLLTLSAQRHSEYQASIGSWTHSGPDGSRTVQRAQAVGYPATRANENVYSGHVSPEEAAHWWLTADADHRNNMLHPVMREIGIGAAADSQGVIYYTMDISAQPNVLPIFINGDAYSAAGPNVTLTLTNEGIFPSAPGQIGQASQVMISNSPDFSGAVTQGWAQSIAWTLDTGGGPGQKMVYVRFIDYAGRTADSQDSIILESTAGAAPQPTVPPSTAAPVVPTSAPAGVPVQPQPTVQPQARVSPTDAPTATPDTAPLVAERPIAPTLDFSDSLYMRSKRGEAIEPGSSEQSQDSGPLASLPLRQWMQLALLAGVAAIAIGLLRLVSFRRALSARKEAPSDGDD